MQGRLFRHIFGTFGPPQEAQPFPKQRERRYGLVQDCIMNGANMSTSMMLTTPLALRSKRLSY